MTIIFFTSLILISLLLVLKYWEVSTGNKIMAEARSGADIFIENQIRKQVIEIPNLVQNSKSLSKIFAVRLVHGTVVFALTIVRFFERHLAGAVDSIRGRHVSHLNHGVSPFLKKMGDEDKN